MAIKLFELGYLVAVKGVQQAIGSLGALREKIEGLEGSTRLGLGMGLEGLGEGLASVGEKTKGALEGLVDAAADTDSAITKLSAVSGWNAEQLDAAREAAEKYSSAHLGTTEEFLAVLQTTVPVYHDQAASLAVATTAMKLHAATGIADSEALSLIIEANKTFGTDAQTTAGQLAAVTKVFGLRNLDGIAGAFGRLSGAVKAAHGGAAEALGVMAEMQQILGPEGAGRAAMALAEVLTHASKYGIDASHGLVGALDQVHARLATMSPSAQIDYLSKVFGATAGVRMLPLIDNIGALRENLAKVGASAPAAIAGMEGIAESSSAAKLAIFNQQMANLKETLGVGLLPALNGVLGALGGLLTRLREFAATHQRLMTGILAFAGVMAGLALVAGVLLPIAGTFALIAGAVGGAAIATAAWAVGIAAAIAAAVALLYTFWPQITGFFTGMIPQAFEWGVNILKTLAGGIESAALYPIHALEGVLKRMRAYLPFSPAKAGPLRDLHRIRLVETIAEAIKPAPLTAAMARVGTAAMVAAPLMFGAGNATAAASPTNVTVNYVINGANAEEWASSARKHADDLVHIIDEQFARRSRRRF